MSKGILAVGIDNLRQRIWDPLFSGIGGQKAIQFDGSHDGLLGWINMATGFDGTVWSPDDPIAQIKANKRTIHAAVKLISSSLAMTPLRVYRPKSKGEKSNFKIMTVKEVPEPRKRYLYEKATAGSVLAMSEDLEEVTGGHILVDLLKNVNGIYDNYILKALSAMYLPITGDCYWVLVKNKLGLPAAIWIASSEYMRPIPDQNTLIGGYKYKQGHTEKLFEPDEVVHFMNPAPGVAYQFHGRGDTAGAADAFQLTEMIQKFEQRVFKNNASLGGVLSTSTRTSEEEQKKLLEQFNTSKAGVQNAGSWMVMANVEPKPLMLTPKELDYQNARETLMNEMMRNFAVPQAMMTGQVSTRAALEASLTQFAMYSTAPLCTLMSEALNAQLASLYPTPLIIAFDNPVMADKQFQLKEDAIYLKYGVVAPDDIRVRKGFEPFGGLSAEPWVDSSRVPLSMVGQEIDTDENAAQVNALMERAKAIKRGA